MYVKAYQPEADSPPEADTLSADKAPKRGLVYFHGEKKGLAELSA